MTATTTSKVYHPGVDFKYWSLLDANVNFPIGSDLTERAARVTTLFLDEPYPSDPLYRDKVNFQKDYISDSIATGDPITDSDYRSYAVDLAGVLTGVKPVAYLGYRLSDDIADRLGIVQYLAKRDDVGGIVAALAKNQSLAQDMAESILQTIGYRGGPQEELNRKIGQALGYPTNDIEFYIKRLQAVYRTFGQTPKYARISNVPLSFQRLIISPDNLMQTYRLYCLPLARSTARLFPKIYRAVIADSAINPAKENDRFYDLASISLAADDLRLH